MNVLFSNKLNILFPLKLFNNNHIYLKKKYIIIKYLSFKFPKFSFIKSINYITNTYSTVIKLFHRIKKSNIINRNNLSKSTKKPWPQKGLGKARAGSFKSPLWRGGSTLFGPINRIVFIILQTKKKKLSFFYLFLNKRTYISFIFIMPTIHTFYNITEYLNQQKRIKGIFSKKLSYIIFNKMKKNNNNSLMSINSLNFISFLKFDYIVFLI